MRPLRSDLGIPVPVIQMERRASADAAKPETWEPFEAQFAEAPFPELIARLGENEEPV